MRRETGPAPLRTNPATRTLAGRRTANRTQLPDEVAAYVRELIASGEVRPGEFLRIERIAEAVAVSQTPVREGLLLLKSEGLVDLLPRRGFVVNSISAEDVSDLFWAQAQVAGELAARAADKITDEELEVLAANVVGYARGVEAKKWELIPQIGQDFHRDLNRAAQSRRLVLLLEGMSTNWPNRFYASRNPEHTNREHPQLLDALRDRDRERARALMVEHVVGQGRRLVEAFADGGHWAGSPQDP